MGGEGDSDGNCSGAEIVSNKDFNYLILEENITAKSLIMFIQQGTKIYYS